MQFRRFTHDFILSFDTFNVTSLPLNNDIISNNTLPVNFSRTTKTWAALIWKDTQMNNVLQASNSDREPTGCLMFDKTFYSEVPCLEQGSHVIIQNLQTTKHNGKTGILQDFDPVKERWCVKVIEGPTEYIPNGGVINVTATVKKYRLKTANVKLLANTTPLYQTIADYRALDFPGQCELIWRTVLATCIYFEYLPETILLPSPRFISVLGPMFTRRLGIQTDIWLSSFDQLETWSTQLNIVSRGLLSGTAKILKFEDDEPLIEKHSDYTASQIYEHAKSTLKKLDKKCKKPKKLLAGRSFVLPKAVIPNSWYVVPKGYREKNTLCWGFRSNLEFACKRGNIDVVEIIANAPPRESNLLNHLMHVWIFCESRILLRRAAERGFLDMSVLLLDVCHCTVDGIGYEKTPCGSIFLKTQQEDAGSQGMTPLLVCCYPVKHQTEATEQQQRLADVTEEQLNQIGRMFLQRGADIHAPSWPHGGRQGKGSSVTPIFMACLNVKMDLIRDMMKDSTFDPKRKIGDGNSPYSLLKGIVDKGDPGWKTYREVLRLFKGKDKGKSMAATFGKCELMMTEQCFKREGTKKCACGQVKYCSVEHQKKHWPVHKLTCTEKMKKKKKKKKKKKRENTEEK